LERLAAQIAESDIVVASQYFVAVASVILCKSAVLQSA
jgi:hypothetical protein